MLFLFFFAESRSHRFAACVGTFERLVSQRHQGPLHLNRPLRADQGQAPHRPGGVQVGPRSVGPDPDRDGHVRRRSLHAGARAPSYPFITPFGPCSPPTLASAPNRGVTQELVECMLPDRHLCRIDPVLRDEWTLESTDKMPAMEEHARKMGPPARPPARPAAPPPRPPPGRCRPV